MFFVKDHSKKGKDINKNSYQKRENLATYSLDQHKQQQKNSVFLHPHWKTITLFLDTLNSSRQMAYCSDRGQIYEKTCCSLLFFDSIVRGHLHLESWPILNTKTIAMIAKHRRLLTLYTQVGLVGFFFLLFFFFTPFCHPFLHFLCSPVSTSTALQYILPASEDQ